MIMKGCVQWNPVYGLEAFASSGPRTGSMCRTMPEADATINNN